MSGSSDYELALLLQLEYDTELDSQKLGNFDDESDCKTLIDLEKSLPHGYTIPVTPPPKKSSARKSDEETQNRNGKKMSIVDPQWELLDPSPDIHALFIQYNATFFYGKLSSAEVRWSPRMTLCAGLCLYQPRGGFCSIRLSAPLLKLRPRKDLVETLLHEMIHAFLFLTHNNKDHDDHGPEFKKHMARINVSEGTAISVYHSFHDEVNSYRQHWWRCDGPCKDRKPFFGWVKRSMNRVPSARDLWWQDHQRTCGGTYIKVKEPEGYKKKGEKKKKELNGSSTSAPTNKNIQTNNKNIGSNNNLNKNTNNNNDNTSKNKDIRNFFNPGDQKSIDVDDLAAKLENGNSDLDHRQKQTKSAKVIDNIGKGLSSRGNIQSARDLLSLTEKTNVGNGVGKDGNIHSVGKFLKGESTKSEPSTSVSAFTGSGSKLGGSNDQPTSGCHKSRLLTAFDARNSDNRGQKRKSDEFSIDKNKKAKPNGIRNSINISGRVSSDNEKPKITNGVLGSKPSTQTQKSPQKNDIRDFFTSPPRHKPVDVSTSSSVKEEKVPCPVCGVMVVLSTINDHLNSCLT